MGSLVRLLQFEDAQLVEVTLAADSPAVDKPIMELGVPRDATVVAVVRSGHVVVPRGDTVLQATFSQYSGKYNAVQFSRNTNVGNSDRYTLSYVGPAGEGFAQAGLTWSGPPRRSKQFDLPAAASMFVQEALTTGFGSGHLYSHGHRRSCSVNFDRRAGGRLSIDVRID